MSSTDLHTINKVQASLPVPATAGTALRPRSSVATQGHKLTHGRRTPLARLARRVVVALSGAALLTTMSVAPADAAVTTYGAVGSAYADSSSSTRQVVVGPQTTPMSGYSNQSVVYRVVARDATNNVLGPWKYYGWKGPYNVPSMKTTTHCDVRSCETVYIPGPTALPKFSFYGNPGRYYDVFVQFGYWTANGYVYGSTRIEACLNSWVDNGVTMSVRSTYCRT